MQLLPTKDEALALRSYLPPIDAPQSEIDGEPTNFEFISKSLHWIFSLNPF